MTLRTKIFVLGLLLMAWSCAQSPYERGGHPSRLSRYDVERDYMECEYKARLVIEQHFYSPTSPFPFGSGPQSPADHARALHGLSTINGMRDTCLAAKGYRLNQFQRAGSTSLQIARRLDTSQ
jgi:hypothetical protein